MIQTDVVSEGEELPCDQQDIIHTEEIESFSALSGDFYLRIWFVDN